MSVDCIYVKYFPKIRQLSFSFLPLPLSFNIKVYATRLCKFYSHISHCRKISDKFPLSKTKATTNCWNLQTKQTVPALIPLFFSQNKGIRARGPGDIHAAKGAFRNKGLQNRTKFTLCEKTCKHSKYIPIFVTFKNKLYNFQSNHYDS